MNDLTLKELHELSFIISQMTRDEIEQIYLPLNMSSSRKDAAISAAFSAREKMAKTFKALIADTDIVQSVDKPHEAL